MDTCRAKLTAGGKRLAQVKIKRGIFEGDELSPLLFEIARKEQPLNVLGRHQTVCQNNKELETLIQTVKIYSQDIKWNLAQKNSPC